jgi:hypothetical protein
MKSQAFMAPVQAAARTRGSVGGGIKSVARNFYDTLSAMLENYGKVDEDLVLPDGKRIAAELKYDFYGSYMFNHWISNLQSMFEGAFTVENTVHKEFMDFAKSALG